MYIPFNVRSFNIAYCVLYSTLNLFIQLVQAIGVAVWRHDSYIFLRFLKKSRFIMVTDPFIRAPNFMVLFFQNHISV